MIRFSSSTGVFSCVNGKGVLGLSLRIVLISSTFSVPSSGNSSFTILG